MVVFPHQVSRMCLGAAMQTQSHRLGSQPSTFSPTRASLLLLILYNGDLYTLFCEKRVSLITEQKKV